MYRIKLFLDKRRKAKKGFPVKVELYGFGNQYWKGTGYYQNFSRLRLTPELTEVLSMYQERVKFVNEYSLDFESAKELISQGFDNRDKLAELKRQVRILEKRQSRPLQGFIWKIIEEKGAAGMSVDHLVELSKEMKKFRSDLDINEISYQLLVDYEKFKRQTGTGRGTMIDKTVRSLRMIYNEARRRKLVANTEDYPFDGFKVVLEPKKKKELISLDQLRELNDFIPKKGTTKVSQENMKRAIALFKFQIAIGGHDMIDVAGLRWLDYVDGRIQFYRYKLRSHDNPPVINNLVLPEAKSFIDEYGTPSEDRIFSWIAKPGSYSYKQQNKYQLRTLARVSETAQIPKLGTKAPRYIFRTVGGQLGINEILLAQIMVHKLGGVSFRYQADLSRDTQDEAHRQIFSELYAGGRIDWAGLGSAIDWHTPPSEEILESVKRNMEMEGKDAFYIDDMYGK